MKKNLMIVLGIIVIAVLALVIVLLWPTGTANAPTNTGNNATTTPNEVDNSSGIPDLISVGNIIKNQKVTSPLTVTGSARGTWYFEASFPVELKDANGKTIAQVPAQAQSNWMTEDFVIFKATLTFPAQPAGSKGTLILHKDNPSGEPERDQQIEIPVTF